VILFGAAQQKYTGTRTFLAKDRPSVLSACRFTMLEPAAHETPTPQSEPQA
jgi:hypothetical protein